MGQFWCRFIGEGEAKQTRYTHIHGRKRCAHNSKLFSDARWPDLKGSAPMPPAPISWRPCGLEVWCETHGDLLQFDDDKRAPMSEGSKLTNNYYPIDAQELNSRAQALMFRALELRGPLVVLREHWSSCSCSGAHVLCSRAHVRTQELIVRAQD